MIVLFSVILALEAFGRPTEVRFTITDTASRPLSMNHMHMPNVARAIIN
jgi:hypothetical protein